MEETIGYEALFSAEEWDSLDIVDWEPDGPDPDAVHTTNLYEVLDGFEIECELCGVIGTAATPHEAEAIKALHESFTATIITTWEVAQ